MAYIKLKDELHGIRGAMAFRPETAKPLNELVEVLLRGPHSLFAGERELIATYVSYLNDCHYWPDDPWSDCCRKPRWR